MKCEKCQWDGYNYEKHSIKQCRDILAEKVRKLKNKVRRQQKEINRLCEGT